MNIMQDIRFEDPWLLGIWLLIPAYLIWYYRYGRLEQWRWKISSTQGMRSPSSFRSILAESLPWWNALALFLIILSLGRPQRIYEEEEVKAEGMDIFLVMDVSSSMLSRDFEPDRLTVSKQVAVEFVDKRPYDRIGLTVFAGEAYTQSPLTTDKEVLKTFLTSLQVGNLADGTAIGMGLAAAVNRLKDAETRSKIIILLTDGVNNSGYIAPQTASELAQKFGIRVYTIGVGSEGMALSPVGRRPDGEFVFNMARVQIDEALLKRMSSETGGVYFRATTAELLRQVYAEIDQLEKTELEITVFRKYTDLYRPFTIAGIAFLFLGWTLKHMILRVWPD
jgi:Ca-activated chloride channel family protein